jgi:hypothetical protein
LLFPDSIELVDLNHSKLTFSSFKNGYVLFKRIDFKGKKLRKNACPKAITLSKNSFTVD